jgi:hypothetical protein
MQVRIMAKTAGTAGVSLLLAAALGVPALANETLNTSGTSYLLAIQTTEVVRALDGVEMAKDNAAHPNITCDLPVAAGAPTSPHFRVGTLSNDGADTVSAFGRCYSATAEKFIITTTAYGEWFDEATNKWNPTGCVVTDNNPSINGVGEVHVADPLCLTSSASWNKPHRVRAVTTTDRFADGYTGYSLVYAS